MGRTLLSDAFDLGVAVALVVGVGVARVGRTLLSDALDPAVDLGLTRCEIVNVGRTVLVR